MKLLLAVVDDLYTFAVHTLLRRRSKKDEYITLGYPESEGITTAEHRVKEDEPEAPIFQSLGEIVAKETNALSPAKNTVMYVGGAETPLYERPTKEFDTILFRLPYGAMVMVLKQQGRWVQVAYNGNFGWMLREELLDRAAHVYPHFVVGEHNRSQDPNTIRTRAIIGDLFGGGAADIDLQAGEYVQYRLTRKGLTIPWGSERPRTPGRWHTLLKGAAGVHIGVHPKTGSVLEYMMQEDRGHVAFVEAVFPDETIHLSEANYPDSGTYNERVLSRNEWKELKPVFIQVL